MTFLEHLDKEFAHSKQAFLFTLGKLPKAKTIVINIGVNSLVHDTGLLNIRSFKNFVKDVAELVNSHPDRHVVIVVSDYIEKSLPKYLHDMPSKNSALYAAFVALVHNDLANLFCDGFAEFSFRAIGISAAAGAENASESNKMLKNLESIAFSQTKSAEVKVNAIKDLLNSKKMTDKMPKIHLEETTYGIKKTTDTLRGLLRHFPRTIPIVMEDVSAENAHGDEEFAAKIAAAMNADAFVAISKKGMLFTVDPNKQVRRNRPFYCYDTGRNAPFAEARKATLAKKLNAAAYLGENDKPIPMLLTANDRPFAIANIFSEDIIDAVCNNGDFPHFTLFTNSKNAALPIDVRYISGKIVIDSNAAKALVSEKRSLLLAGVVEVDGSFETKSVVLIADNTGAEIGKGVVNFSSEEIQTARKDSTKDIEIISREKMRLHA